MFRWIKLSTEKSELSEEVGCIILYTLKLTKISQGERCDTE